MACLYHDILLPTITSTEASLLITIYSHPPYLPPPSTLSRDSLSEEPQSVQLLHACEYSPHVLWS